MSDTAEVKEEGSEKAALEEPTIEDQARKRGWISKEEWKGADDKHVTAEDFMEIKDGKVATLKERMEEATAARKAAESAAEEARNTSKEFKKYMDEVRAKDKKTHEAELAKLKAERSAAVEEADTARFNQVDAEIDRVEEAQRAAEVPAQEEFPKEIKEFHERNPWFNSDPAMSATANIFFRELNGNGVPLSEATAATEDYVKRLFPEKFTNPKREAAPPVERGAAAPAPKSNGRGYSSLPAEAKTACDKFVKQIPGFTKEQFLANYEWS